MREYEIQLILKWVGSNRDGTFNEQRIRDAINYAYKMGFTDGSGGGAGNAYTVGTND